MLATGYFAEGTLQELREESSLTDPDVQAPLMPALHALQHHAGYIDAAHIPLLADTFDLSVAEVHGVITFYKDFRTAPPAGPTVHVCRAEACQSMGANELVGMIERFLKVKLGQTTADGAITVEAAYCLGNCAVGPSLLIDMQLKGRVTPERFDRLTGVVA